MATTLSEASFGKIVNDSLAGAKKKRKKNQKQELKWAKDSLGHSLLHLMELLDQGRKGS